MFDKSVYVLVLHETHIIHIMYSIKLNYNKLKCIFLPFFFSSTKHESRISSYETNECVLNIECKRLSLNNICFRSKPRKHIKREKKNYHSSNTANNNWKKKGFQFPKIKTAGDFRFFPSSFLLSYVAKPNFFFYADKIKNICILLNFDKQK